MQLPPQSKPLVINKPPEEKLEPHELEMRRKQELLAKVKTIREKLAASLGEVDNRKPDKVYVWVNDNENRQIHYQTMGYETCKDPEVKSKWKKADNSHHRGDLVLYHIDKDLHEAIIMEAQLRAIEGLESAREGFKATLQREGVPVYEPGRR